MDLITELDLKVVDVDTHVVEHYDLWTSRVSTAKYGDLTRGPRVVNKATKREMKKILAEIQDGKFARQWISETKRGRRKYSKLLKSDLNHSIEKIGAKLRARMPWLETAKA